MRAPGGFAADKAGEVEYAGKELALFLAELAKGNPKNVEPLFTRAPRRSVHESAVWRALRARRAEFLTGRAVIQYRGFVKDRTFRFRRGVRPLGTFVRGIWSSVL